MTVLPCNHTWHLGGDHFLTTLQYLKLSGDGGDEGDDGGDEGDVGEGAGDGEGGVTLLNVWAHHT